MTGGTGFIGNHLVKRLRGAPLRRLLVLSRSARSSTDGEITWVVGSLDQLSRDRWAVAGVDRIDILIHLGAFTPKNSSAADQVSDVYRDNLLGTRALLESLPSAPERVVFSSTIDVYSPPGQGAFLTESSAVGPSNLYASSKLFCEQLLRVYARSSGCPATVLRYGHIFGPGEEAYEKLIPQLIRMFLGGQAPVLYGDGSTRRDYLYVTDAVEATIRAASSNSPGLGLINVVRGEATSIGRVAEMLGTLTRSSVEPRYLRDRDPGPSLGFDSAAMRKTLGDWPLVPLEAGLAEEVRYFRELAVL